MADASSQALRQLPSNHVLDAALRKQPEPRDLAPRESVVTSASPTSIPVLLTTANYYGTLAAVRALGQAGIRVVTADPSRFAVSSWSKHTASRMRCPSVRDADRFVEWLLDFGAKHGKHVLLPTSDDTAWLYSLHRDELSRYFYLASPTVDVVYRFLNKKSLYHEAQRSGLSAPRTWFPETPQDLVRVAHEARFPVVVKPRTQVMFRTQSKGAFVESPDQLARFYNVIAGQPHEATLVARDPQASLPAVQEFHPHATGIYNIAAYVHQGQLWGARAARKILQQPRRLGTGVCFEEAEVVPALAAALERMVARIGFSGVFEAEFIITSQDALLIDFNPRFYNQMQFDITRGLPLPLLAYYDALGADAALDAHRERIGSERVSDRVYVDLMSLHTLLSTQRLSGVLTKAERKQWTDWYAQHRDRCTYAVLDSTDGLPFWLAAAQLLLRYLRHPRNFLRSIVLNRYCFIGMSSILSVS